MRTARALDQPLRTVQLHDRILTVTPDLSNEQVRRRPADVAPSVAPSIAWHL